MSRLITGRRGALSRLTGDKWGERSGLMERGESGRPSPALLITGAVAVGLLAWAAYQFGPELRRYMKIKAM